MCSWGFCRRCSNIRRVIMLIYNVKSKNYIKWCTIVLMQFAFHHCLYTEHHNYLFLLWKEAELQKKENRKSWCWMWCVDSPFLFIHLINNMCMYFFSYKNKSSSKICQSNKKRVENNLAFCALQSVPYQRIVGTVQVRKKKRSSS